ncbi:MAG: bifunctional adenosylcobinamide kinase/adenosylcobinamide-phosphate guanylyltransferase [Eggerthellaceae bacterium]|nr:bifunctional adenosylcobinamide kinase/adenosylcobinamide-phosphate guanylyltransferase [Eggerthellaceae bacterium]
MIALVTGGASSGKSACAESLAVSRGGDLVYLATMHPAGEEGARRVARHRAQRAGKGFRTVECYEGLEGALAEGAFDGATVLLEDLGNLVATELFAPDAPANALRAGRSSAELARRAGNLVVVGNEVGSDGMAYESDTRIYQSELGRLACEVSAMSDVVVECVAGIARAIKAQAGSGLSAETAEGCSAGAEGSGS